MTKNKDQILKTTSLSLILVLLIMIGFLMVKVNELQDQLYNLNNELSSVRGAVNSINGNIRSEFNNILDELEEQAKNFSNVSTTILDYEDGFLTVNIKFTLKEITNGSIVKVICENTKTLESHRLLHLIMSAIFLRQNLKLSITKILMIVIIFLMNLNQMK